LEIIDDDMSDEAEAKAKDLAGAEALRLLLLLRLLFVVADDVMSSFDISAFIFSVVFYLL